MRMSVNNVTVTANLETELTERIRNNEFRIYGH
jgi:hypothetical protein